MNNVTDIEKVKEKSKALYFAVSMKEASDACGLDGLIISHPFTNTGVTAIQTPEGIKMVDIINDKNNENEFRKNLFQLIDEANNVWKIVILVNKPYRLYWFKIVRRFLSDKDYAEMLKEVWTGSENPNDDINVSLTEVIQYFKKANKEYLMDEKEYKIYSALPDQIQVYRGVSTGRNPNGLSYTIDKDKAIWFQNRYADKDHPGFLIEKIIPKNKALAFFGNRGEMEIVVDVS